MQAELVKQLVGLVVRAGLMSLGTYLVTHHVMTSDQVDGFTSDMFTHVMLAAPAVGALVWSGLTKLRNTRVLATALNTPAGASLDDVKRKVDGGAGTPLAAVALAVLLGAGMSASCATGGVLKPGPNGFSADQVKTILVFAQQGVQQGCAQEWIPANACTIIVPGLDAGVAAVNQNPAGAIAAGRDTLQAIWNRLPADSRARPYIKWAVILLGGAVQ